MRRSDKVFAILAWGALLAGLAWAYTTQFRMIQEAKPIQVKRPAAAAAEASEPPPVATPAVIGTITDDTRAAMLKALRARRTGTSEQVSPKARVPEAPR